MPNSVEYSQHRSHSPVGDALTQILEDDEGSIQAVSMTERSIPPTDLGTNTQSVRSVDSRRNKSRRKQASDSIPTSDSVVSSEFSASTGAKTTSTTVEKHHSTHRNGKRHIIHEKIITHETRASGSQPTSRHHTIILTDPEGAARREKRRAEREAQQARRAERELKREQQRERRERREARKAHSRDLERVIAALQAQSRSRTSSRRSPITPTTRSGTIFEEELERLKFALSESEKDSETLRNKLRELTDRLELESKRAAAAEAHYKEYHSRLRNAEVARKKAEADAARESEESSRLKVIYETARAQQEDIQRELDALQEERDEADREAADARSKARKFQEELLVNQAREAGRREGRREARRDHKHKHRHEKEKVVERIIERLPPEEEPTPRIVTESGIYDEVEDTESRHTTPRAHTPDLPEREQSPLPPPPPPIIPPQHTGNIDDLPGPPQDIQMPQVVDPAPLPPVPGGSTWSNWKSKLGGKLKRSGSRSETFSQDSYFDDPGMSGGGHPTYPPSDRDNPSRSQYTHTDHGIPSQSQYQPSDRDIPSRSQYQLSERDIPSRSMYPPERDIPQSMYPPERDIPSRSQNTSRGRSPSSEYHPPPPPPVPATGMTSMAGVGSMAGMGGMSGIGGMSGMHGLTTLVPGPGSGPGLGPGAGPIAGPSGIHMPPPPQDMKASRKSARRAKTNVPPPQPVFPPPPAPEAPIHPIPYNNGLASPWHHKPAPILPEGWIPEADDEGHIDIPPAHEIHPSPLLMNGDLNERSQHPVVPSAPLPKTPKHRAGSHPAVAYPPMVIPDEEEDYDSDGIEIPIAHEPPFDPLAVRTPAHYGRPLSVIPELSPEYNPPPIPDAPLPSARQSTRSGHSHPQYRHEEYREYSPTESMESASQVHRPPIRRRPSTLTPTSPAPPVVQQHVVDDPRTPPPPVVPNAQIPVVLVSPDSVPTAPRKTKADRQREREAEHAREKAWEKEDRERARQAREHQRTERERQQQELDRKIQEQRARETYEIERQQDRERKEREREERHRERERRDSERARREREKDLKEKEREQRHREREKNRDRTERRRTYNPTPGAPIVPPNPIVAPSPAPETSPHESNAPPLNRPPLSEDRQITFPMPHLVSPPAEIVGGPVIVDGPSRIVEPPTRIVNGPSRIGGGPTQIGEGPAHIGVGPGHIGEGPAYIGEGPAYIGEGPAHIGEGPAHIGEGPTYVAKPSERIVPPIIPPPPIPDGHYAPYSPMSGPGSAGTEARRRSYNYAPAASATPITPHTQPGPSSLMKMPTPEPWNDPANPRRRGNADEAAISAYVRAVEQARKLQSGEEDDDEDEESVQRYVKNKFGDLSGNHSDSDEEESDEEESEESEEETESQSSSEMTESTVSDPRDNQSRASVPTIVLNSPSNDSNGSSAMTHVSDGRLLNPEYRPAPRSADDYTYDDPMEYETNSLENEPLDLDDIPLPGAPSFDPYANPTASPATRHYGLPSDYVDAPRTGRYSSASVTRPPPLAPDFNYNSRWGPPQPTSAGLPPPGLPDFTNFDDVDSFKHGSNNHPPRSNPSRASGRDSASSASRPNTLPAPPSVIITPAVTSQPSTQRTTTIDLAPPGAPERTPNQPAPGFATRLGAGLSGFGFSRPNFMRTSSAQQVPPPVHAPVADQTPGPPILPSPVPSRSSMHPSQAAPRAPSGMGTRPEINRVRGTMGPSLQVPMAGSPIRPNVVASKPPPQQPKGFPLTRPSSGFTDRNKNKTRAQVEAFQALRDEQDLERQRQWDVGHMNGDDAEKSRPSSPQGSVRSRKSRAVTVVSTSDEDGWTTGRSVKGRPL